MARLSKSWSPESLKHPELEFLEEARVRIPQSLLIRGRQLPHEFQPGSLFTNRFVPDIPAKPAPFWFRGRSRVPAGRKRGWRCRVQRTIEAQP